MIPLPSDVFDQSKFFELVKIRGSCQAALEKLSAALRMVNRQVDQLRLSSRQSLVECLEAANRALADLSGFLQRQDAVLRRVRCPVCHGERQVTERGVIQRRVTCPACKGTGIIERPPLRHGVVGKRLGKRQRFILRRLSNLGGANWPIPTRKLWGHTARSPAARAALSRALRQLEKLGLVTRSHAGKSSAQPPVRRASQAQLTAAGQEQVHTLTKSSKR
jgi:DNA-binding MarR family transcriptional regulator